MLILEIYKKGNEVQSSAFYGGESEIGSYSEIDR